ncbi:alpha-helical protein [Cryptosporidium tyzzeri]|nr:alpha-helical protein [Cryptosporidium tyzzeri]
MSKDEQKKIDSSYDNVIKKPIKLLKHKNSNSKLGIKSIEKNLVQTNKLANNLECEKNFPESLVNHSTLNDDAKLLVPNPIAGIDKTTGYTKAELSHKEAQRKKVHKQIEFRASLTHRQRVSKFNEKLSMLPEHFDIPKVGPG